MTQLLSVDDILQLYLETFNIRTDLPIGIYIDEKFTPLYTEKAIKDLPDFCKLMKKDPMVYKFCEEDHKKRANCLSENRCEYCHMGIANYKHPLIINNKHFGTLLTGKRRISGNDGLEWEKFKKGLERIEESYAIRDLQKRELEKEFTNVKKITSENFQKSCREVINVAGSFIEQVLLIRENAINTEKDISLSIQLSAHELIGPLVSIKGDAELLEELLKSSKNRKLLPLEDYEELISTCRSMWNATERLRVFADNLRCGLIDIEGDYKFKIHSLSKVVKNCIEPYQSMADEKKVVIQSPKLKQYNPRGPYGSYNSLHVEISLAEFELALKNLIHNAVKYSYYGTEKEYKIIKIKGDFSKYKGYYELSISNLGIGIEPDEIKNRTITQKFIRGNLSNDRERVGTGMGLYVVDRVIKKHNGRLDFSSEFKGGPYLNIFTITFPIYQGMEAIPW